MLLLYQFSACAPCLCARLTCVCVCLCTATHHPHSLHDQLLSTPTPPQAKGLDLKEVDVPVVGGHAGITILPLLSQVRLFLYRMRGGQWTTGAGEVRGRTGHRICWVVGSVWEQEAAGACLSPTRVPRVSAA